MKMRLMIEIPKEQFITLNAKSQKEVLAVIDYNLFIYAIKNGKPLLDDLISKNDMLDAVGHGTTYTTEEVQDIIDSLPVIVEADGGDFG